MRRPDDTSTSAGYRIKTVSELTGIPKNTLIAWERRYGLLEPKRLPNGYRVYSDEDVALLVQIKTALGEGLQISEAVGLIAKRDRTPAPAPSNPAAPSEDGFALLRGQLEKALLAYDRTTAEQITQRLVGLPFAAAIDRVYFPLLRAVGDKWEAEQISVAQEHFASAFVREQLIAMLIGVRCGPPHGVHVACTTFPNDPHEIGVLGLAVMLANHGCRVTYLGANTPLDALSKFARAQQPAWICVSVILPVPESELLAFAETLREEAPAATRIAIGGGGLPARCGRVGGVTFLDDWHDLSLLR